MKQQMTSDEELNLKRLLREYRTARNAAQPFLDEMAELREEIKTFTIATGIEVDVTDAYTEIVRGHIRKSWETKKLLVLSEVLPEILTCRKETQIQRGVRIKNGERKKQEENE